MEIWIMGSLYVSAVAFITLLFQYINYFFVDIANPYSYSGDVVRWTIAILVAVVLAHVFVLRAREKDYASTPEKRHGKLRRWLVYLTLFAAATACIVDFATLVYYFLDGELSARFILKVLVVGAVAGGVFWYYLKDVKREDSVVPRDARVARLTGLAVVVFGILWGFYVTGSPFAARVEKIDAQRVADLQTIQWQIVNYWQSKQQLPATLDELTDLIGGFRAPVDPETAMAYEYIVVAPTSFKLCATFAAKSVDGNERLSFPVDGWSWAHEAGRNCFDREIDPDLYPPKESSIKPITVPSQ